MQEATKTGAPYFSIIVPCYNHGHFLSDCLNSVLESNFVDWELIVVNDGSSDQTAVIASAYVNKDSRIRLVTQPNAGLSAARNTGISLARGEFIHFLDADDLVTPSCYDVISKQVSKDKSDVVVCGYSYVKDGHLFHTHNFKYTTVCLEEFFGSNIAPPVAFFISRMTVDHIGLFDVSLKSCEDWDFWIRAVKAGACIRTIQEVAVLYRYVPGSMSRNAFQMYDALKEVSIRAARKDTRLSGYYPLNVDHDVNIADIVKFQLFRCLGVSIMQGKIKDSVALFLKERQIWNWVISVDDYKGMSSYLSFRYFLKKEEIRSLLKDVKPLFEEFFKAIGLTEKDMSKALALVFETQIKRNNHHRYGRYIGAFVNRLSS